MTKIPKTDAADNDGGIRGRVAILIMDTVREGAKGSLDGWLGEQNAAIVRAHGSRYVVILTIDTGGDPRYAHNIGCAPDMPTVIDELARASQFVERIGYDLGLCSPGTPNACMTDVRLSLDAADTSKIDAWLDDVACEFLRRTDSTVGRA
jgi:hypothetical protein